MNYNNECSLNLDKLNKSVLMEEIKLKSCTYKDRKKKEIIQKKCFIELDKTACRIEEREIKHKNIINNYDSVLKSENNNYSSDNDNEIIEEKMFSRINDKNNSNIMLVDIEQDEKKRLDLVIIDENKKLCNNSLISKLNSNLFTQLKKEIIEVKNKREQEISDSSNIYNNNLNEISDKKEALNGVDINMKLKKSNCFSLSHVNKSIEENKEINMLRNDIKMKNEKNNIILSKIYMKSINLNNKNDTNSTLRQKPGKRSIRIKSLQSSLFKKSIFEKIFENSNELKKFDFLKDKNTYLKLFESAKNENKEKSSFLKKINSESKNSDEIKIFDENTYKNVFIVMKKLKIPMEDLHYILYNMKENKNFQEEFEYVENLIPNDKYISELKNLQNKSNWKDIESKLRNTEKVLLPICNISRIKNRIRIFKFYYTIEKVKNKLHEIFNLYDKVCNELKNSKLLIEIFQAILMWVNFVNNGDTENFEIKSIDLSHLSKLKYFKTTGGKFNALDYIIVNMISYNSISNINDIIYLREILKKIHIIKGCEILEEISYIEKEINHINEEIKNYKDEYSNVIVVLIKIMDKSNIIFDKINNSLKNSKENILSLSSFYGFEEILLNKDIMKFPASELLFKELFVFIDDVYDIMNEIIRNPIKMNILLIDEEKKLGNFKNNEFYKKKSLIYHSSTF
ncbi:formin 2, putative [Plasmodium gallinaceum]|uniref:Formin 2, putative n=1 Tax=Plasmodium gallinaceum TaxID=5849 RepID=A0A1J1GVM7_PLAGA|nr:formin 2, putative [Plasmodium gallinaceum]CRG96372.1 formin 2, putative [Plasmodium gallinaceum]